MKNLKIRSKLMVSFIIVAVLAAIAGIFGVLGSRTISSNESVLYQYAINTERFTALQRNIQAQRAAYRGAALKSDLNQDYQSELNELHSLHNDFLDRLNTLENALTVPVFQEYIQQTSSAYSDYYTLRDEFIAAVESGNSAKIPDLLERLTEPIGRVADILDTASANALERIQTTDSQDSAMANQLTVILIVLVVLAVFSAIFFAFYITKLIAAPLGRMATEAQKMAVGNLKVDPRIDQKDEIGKVNDAISEVAKAIIDQEEKIVRMAGGDYSISFHVRSESDAMNQSLNRLVDNFNSAMMEIRDSSNQVSAASEQIAQASTNMATGASEQAATIEEFSASITEIKAVADGNTKEAEMALQENRQAGHMMEGSIASMERMLNAMRKIDDRSQNITKVIKVIDDIAFQTNILALNAAVEAARAGQHGKGFAVVADEVRNLASKSSEAAKETAALIEQSNHSVAEGSAIVDEVNNGLRAVAELARKNAASMVKINDASKHQSDAMAEVTAGIAQLSSVVQSNSATAEETAASSQEMSAQAVTLDNIISQFKLREAAKTAVSGTFKPSTEQSEYQESRGFALSGNSGKY